MSFVLIRKTDTSLPIAQSATTLRDSRNTWRPPDALMFKILKAESGHGLLRVNRSLGQRNGEYRATACLISGFHRAIVQLRYTTHDGKPQARVTSPFAMTTTLKKSLEDVR